MLSDEWRGYTAKVGLRKPIPMTLADYEAIAREFLGRPPNPNYVSDFLTQIRIESRGADITDPRLTFTEMEADLRRRRHDDTIWMS